LVAFSPPKKTTEHNAEFHAEMERLGGKTSPPFFFPFSKAPNRGQVFGSMWEDHPK